MTYKQQIQKYIYIQYLHYNLDIFLLTLQQKMQGDIVSINGLTLKLERNIDQRDFKSIVVTDKNNIISLEGPDIHYH